MTAKQKEKAEEEVLSAVLRRIDRRTRAEWLQKIERYESEAGGAEAQLRPDPVGAAPARKRRAS